MQHLLERNKKWAMQISQDDPEFFQSLAKQQAPRFLWIGCSDSRVAANQIVDVPPGEVFVHRNIANVVVHSDLNCLSVVQYAVEVLKVEQIIVCGHYGCGGVHAALDEGDNGLIDNWLQHIKDVKRFNSAELEGLEGVARADRLCELNVIEQTKNVAQTTIVRDAWARGQELAVHGLIYNLNNGILQDLGVSVDGS